MRKTLSIVLYILVGLPLALSLLVLLAVRPWALDRDFYKSALTAPNLYEILRSPDLAAEMSEKVVVGGYTLSGPALATALQKTAPEAELKALAADAVDGAFDFLEGKTGGRRGSLSLAALKTALLSRKAETATAYVEALPALAGMPGPGDLSFRPLGLPASLIALRASEDYGAFLQKAMPDRLTWPPEGTASPGSAGQASPLAPGRLDGVVAGLAVGTILALLLLSLLGAASLRQGLGLSGAYVLAPSALILVAGTAMAAASAVLLGGLADQGFAGLGLRTWVSGTATEKRVIAYGASVLTRAAGPFFTVGLAGTFLGGLLLALRNYAVRPERE